MAAGEGYGNGCNMPLPSVLFSAIRTALIRNQTSLPKTKTESRHSKDKGKNRKIGLDKFGSLQLKGIFPYHRKYGILYPIPKDVLFANNTEVKTTALGKVRDQIVPLATIPATKDKITDFWSQKQLKAYLNNKYNNINMTPIPVKQLWQPEWHVGVEINPTTFTNEDGQLYAGEYMRMSNDASFITQLSLDETDKLSQIDTIAFGGEKRVCSFTPTTNNFPKWSIPKIPDGEKFILKWILLTPAIFANGSTPGWITDNKVLLQPKINNCKTKINATLVSQSGVAPIHISGWDIIGNHAKPSIYGVQAGAVYYFKCNTKTDAQNLIQALHNKCRSDMLAEKGFGLGLTTISKFTLINNNK